MANKKSSKKKPYGKAIIFGLIASALYVTLLTHQGLITANFTRGGLLYALLPIATAFIFSFFHGTFTSTFWTVLGIEAKKKKEVK